MLPKRACCPCCGKPHDRGRIINTRASLGAEIVQLKERVLHLEKLCKKTPPKTLTVARKMVEDGKVALVSCKARLETALAELDAVRALEATMKDPGTECAQTEYTEEKMS